MPANLNQQARAIWEVNAAFWDDYMGDGNHFYHLLIAPSAEELLAVRPGEHLLEIGCGNGNFARRLAALGARVTAFDGSPTFIERANQRTTLEADQITYRVLDATHPQELASLGQGVFDGAVCNMVLMDLPELQPLFAALPRLLKPGGRFVFTIMHPCFNQLGSQMLIEELNREGEFIVRPAVKVFAYIEPTHGKGVGVRGQPEPQFYFHRPLSGYLNPAFESGFVLDRLEEPVFPPDFKHEHPLSWGNFHAIPPVLACRLRLQSDPERGKIPG